MFQNPRIDIQNAGRGDSRSMAAQWAAVLGGSALAVYGITRRSTFGAALAASGSTIALVAGTQSPRRQKPSALTSILVNCSPADAYRFWRDFQNLPQFMNRLESVEILDNRRSRWTAVGPMSQPITWEAEITEERENERIAWRSLPNSDVEVNGYVEFEEAPAGRGTLITAEMEFSSLPGVSSAVAKFFKKSGSFAIRQDLRRLEALIESGEIPTIEGQPHGPRDRASRFMKVADPTRPMPVGKVIDTFAQRRTA